MKSCKYNLVVLGNVQLKRTEDIDIAKLAPAL